VLPLVPLLINNIFCFVTFFKAIRLNKRRRNSQNLLQRHSLNAYFFAW
jgi:hypothetical protein